MHLISNARGDERGAVAVVVALMMVVMLTMAAFVVDLGGVRAERRTDQTSADSAALAAAAHLAVGDSIATAMAVARDNLTTTSSDAQWSTLWSGCSDPDRDAAAFPIVAPQTPCISFGAGYTRVRVRLPNQILDTKFAPVFGVSTLRAHAAAEAGLQIPPGGGILPFGVLNFLADAQNQVCLTVAGGCGGQNSDTLRAIDSPLVGNPQYGATRVCRPGGFGMRIEFNSAMGIDHVLVPYDGGSRIDDCDIERPNTVYAVSIQNQQALLTDFVDGLGRGLITGRSAYPDTKPPRLHRTPLLPDWPTRSVANQVVDNKPLWEFIPSDATGIPPSCARSNFVVASFDPNPDSTQSGKGRMQRCLSDYIVGGYNTPLFTMRSPETPNGWYDIQMSSRFAFVPSLNCCGDGQIGLAPIQRFNMVFIETVYLDTADKTQFNPGEGGSGPLSMPQFDGIAALRITDPMVPPSVVRSGPGGSLRGAFVSLTS